MSSILLDINQHSRKIVEEASINDTDISRSAQNSVDDLMEFETGLSLSNGKDDWENIQCSGGHNTTTRELVSRIERNAPVPEPLTFLMSARNISIATISVLALEYHANCAHLYEGQGMSRASRTSASSFRISSG